MGREAKKTSKVLLVTFPTVFAHDSMRVGKLLWILLTLVVFNMWLLLFILDQRQCFPSSSLELHAIPVERPYTAHFAAPQWICLGRCGRGLYHYDEWFSSQHQMHQFFSKREEVFATWAAEMMTQRWRFFNFWKLIPPSELSSWRRVVTVFLNVF